MSLLMQPRHNLARLRHVLGLTQGEFGRQVGRSLVTIKAVENSKLPLSESLAAEIGCAFGIDGRWLLANDLESPVPPLNPPLQDVPTKEGHSIALLIHLLSRIFAVARKLRASQARDTIGFHVGWELENLKLSTEADPAAEPINLINPEVLEYFRRHPLNQDLNWINLDSLLADLKRHQKKELPSSTQARLSGGLTDTELEALGAEADAAYDRYLEAEALEAEQWFKKHGHDPEDLTLPQKSKRSRPKLPNQTLASPSRDGRRKKPKSS